MPTEWIDYVAEAIKYHAFICPQGRWGRGQVGSGSGGGGDGGGGGGWWIAVVVSGQIWGGD